MDLATQMGLLAQRALVYEQERQVQVMRLDYVEPGKPVSLGADALQADLATLEAERLIGFNERLPIKWTFSIARDFPLEFGQLQTTGSCLIRTTSDPLRYAYSGSFDHRIRVLEVTAFVASGEVPRGVLFNSGVSSVDGEQSGQTTVITRNPEALFLSDFKIENDMAIYALPNEGLLPFEGSGVDSFWLLTLSPSVGASSLSSLTDVTITCRLTSRYSDAVANALALAGPRSTARTKLFSASRGIPQPFQKFQAGQSNKLTFDIRPESFPVVETDRTVRNIAICFVGDDLPEITGKLSSDSHPGTVTFTTHRLLAHSNIVPPSAGFTFTIPVSPLDEVATGAPDQKWTLTVPASSNSSLQRSKIQDVLFAIEYVSKPKFPSA